MESSVVMSTLLTFFKVLSVSHLVLSNSLRPKDQTQSDSKESACNAGDLGSILGWEEPLEKGMATHSSILAWRIPWTEELAGYSPWGYKELDTSERLTLTI